MLGHSLVDVVDCTLEGGDDGTTDDDEMDGMRFGTSVGEGEGILDGIVEVANVGLSLGDALGEFDDGAGC